MGERDKLGNSEGRQLGGLCHVRVPMPHAKPGGLGSLAHPTI